MVCLLLGEKTDLLKYLRKVIKLLRSGSGIRVRNRMGLDLDFKSGLSTVLCYFEGGIEFP